MALRAVTGDIGSGKASARIMSRFLDEIPDGRTADAVLQEY